VWRAAGVRPGRTAARSCAHQLQDCGSHRQLSFAARGCAGVAVRRPFKAASKTMQASTEHEPATDSAASGAHRATDGRLGITIAGFRHSPTRPLCLPSNRRTTPRTQMAAAPELTWLMGGEHRGRPGLMTTAPRTFAKSSYLSPP
jgi:hypothetical protein